jgi:hypothetical protein
MGLFSAILLAPLAPAARCNTGPVRGSFRLQKSSNGKWSRSCTTLPERVGS